MPGVGDFLKGETGKGIVIGIGVAIVAPLAIAVLSGAARPVARAALKSGILLYEKGREKFAEIGEEIEDLTAEVHAEMEQVHTGGETSETEQVVEEDIVVEGSGSK